MIPIDPYDFPLLCPPYRRISRSYFRLQNARYVFLIAIDARYAPLTPMNFSCNLDLLEIKKGGNQDIRQNVSPPYTRISRSYFGLQNARYVFLIPIDPY